MKAVVQRVSKAAVSVGGAECASIARGAAVFVGIKNADTQKDADCLADKVFNLRIFDDKKGRMNLSASDLRSDFLVVSQFTLYGDCRRGRRPDYTDAAGADTAEPLYNYFVKRLSGYGLRVETGVFGENMLVSLENDGPVTLIVSTD